MNVGARGDSCPEFLKNKFLMKRRNFLIFFDAHKHEQMKKGFCDGQFFVNRGAQKGIERFFLFYLKVVPGHLSAISPW